MHVKPLHSVSTPTPGLFFSTTASWQSVGGLQFVHSSGKNWHLQTLYRCYTRLTVNHTFALIGFACLVPCLILLFPAVGVWGNLGLARSTGNTLYRVCGGRG